MSRASEIRASVPAGASVAQPVAAIIEAVRSGGDAELARYEAEFGAGTEPPFRATGGELTPSVRAGLEVAIKNVDAVATCGLDRDREVKFPQGQTVKLIEKIKLAPPRKS